MILHQGMHIIRNSGFLFWPIAHSLLPRTYSKILSPLASRPILSPIAHRLLPFIIPVLLFSVLDRSTAQINTESLRHKVSQDFSGSASFGLNLARGNTDFLKLDGQFRVDYRKPASHTFLNARYARGERNRQAYQNQAFGHLRYIRNLTTILALEFFAQKEFNDFIRLKDRQLAGTGCRLTLLPSPRKLSMAFGLGLMREHESYKDDAAPVSRIWRITTYLSGAWRNDPRVRLLYAGYLQVNTGYFSDFRILAEIHILFDITKKLTVEMLWRQRYDHSPPADVKKNDFAFMNGIRFSF